MKTLNLLQHWPCSSMLSCCNLVCWWLKCQRNSSTKAIYMGGRKSKRPVRRRRLQLASIEPTTVVFSFNVHCLSVTTSLLRKTQIVNFFQRPYLFQSKAECSLLCFGDLCIIKSLHSFLQRIKIVLRYISKVQLLHRQWIIEFMVGRITMNLLPGISNFLLKNCSSHTVSFGHLALSLLGCHIFTEVEMSASSARLEIPKSSEGSVSLSFRGVHRRVVRSNEEQWKPTSGLANFQKRRYHFKISGHGTNLAAGIAWAPKYFRISALLSKYSIIVLVEYGKVLWTSKRMPERECSAMIQGWPARCQLVVWRALLSMPDRLWMLRSNAEDGVCWAE